MTITIKNHGSDKGPSISGIASGVLFLVVFGALWAAIGINGLQGFDEPWVAIGILLIGLVLLIASLSLRWKTRRLPNRAAEKKEPDRQRKNKWFRIVFATELVAIVSANVIWAVNRSDLFFPVMMLIVGIHFFPLAVLFGINKYYLTGALLSLLAIGTLLVVPEQLQFSGFQITAWWVVLGLGGAFILWGTGFVHWLQGRRLLDQKNHSRTELSPTLKEVPMQTKTYPNKTSLIDEKVGLERLVFFSDAVFAIAITLLALDIHLPVEAAHLTHKQLLTSLLQIWPKYLSFIISFLVIGNFWIAHHHRFSLVTHYDNRLLLLNLLVLMSIAFIPFPTSMISENGNRTATIFYALSIATTGLLSALLWWYASRKNRLIKKDFDKQLARRNLFSILTVPAVFLLSIGLTLINPTLGKLSWILTVPAALSFKINRSHIK